jgi:hypothetical protein
MGFFIIMHFYFTVTLCATTKAEWLLGENYKYFKNFGAFTTMLIDNLTPFKWKIQLKVKL